MSRFRDTFKMKPRRRSPSYGQAPLTEPLALGACQHVALSQAGPCECCISAAVDRTSFAIPIQFHLAEKQRPDAFSSVSCHLCYCHYSGFHSNTTCWTCSSGSARRPNRQQLFQCSDQRAGAREVPFGGGPRCHCRCRLFEIHHRLCQRPVLVQPSTRQRRCVPQCRCIIRSYKSEDR